MSLFLDGGTTGAGTAFAPEAGQRKATICVLTFQRPLMLAQLLVAIGELFTVGFGTEPQLQVNRQMMDKARTMQGGNQILKFEYRILVSSYKEEKVKVQLWDRLPQAENETMGVTLIKAAPDVSTDAMYVREEKPNNLLRWDLDVTPDMTGEKAQLVKYEFKLELDKQMTIGSFQSK